MTFRQYLKISRPRYWLYLFGSFALGAVCADTKDLFWPALAVFAFYFTFPASMLLFGLNDFFDHIYNQKIKANTVNAANKWQVINVVVLWNLPFCVVWLADEMPVPCKLALLGFVFLTVFYSAKPIRAKTKPVLDVLFSSLFVLPGIFAYGLLEYKFPPTPIVAAAALCVASVYVYSRVQKYDSYKKHGQNTTVTLLRPSGALVFAVLAMAAAAALAFAWLKFFGVGLAAFYVLVYLATFIRVRPAESFLLYRVMP